MSIILALGRVRQEDNKFKVSLGYIVRPKKKKKKRLMRKYFPEKKKKISIIFFHF
jgi:hypothetical protein